MSARQASEPDNGGCGAAIDRILGGGGTCFLTTIRSAGDWDAGAVIASAIARGDYWHANVLIAGREFARDAVVSLASRYVSAATRR